MVAGRFLEQMQDSALLVEVASERRAIVGASAGFLRSVGLSPDDVLGADINEVITRGAPAVAVSRSAMKNVSNFCSMCARHEVEQISETQVVQPCSRKDGSTFTALSYMGLCEVLLTRFVLVVHMHLGEGIVVRLKEAQRMEQAEVARETFKRLRGELLRQAAAAMGPEELLSGTSPGSFSSSASVCRSFAFDSGRLQEHCMLANGGRTAMRREADELPAGCLVFSDRPVRALESGDLRFALRVDGIAKGFTGVPLVGFTRRRPRDCPDLHPRVSYCLGESVLVGGAGCRAFARDQHEHFKIGFKQPPQNEVETFSLPPELDAGGKPKVMSPKLKVGDIIECVYTQAGRVQFWLNEERLLDFDVGRPIDHSLEHYAVVDVCLAAASLTIVPLKEGGAAQSADCVPNLRTGVMKLATTSLGAAIDLEGCSTCVESLSSVSTCTGPLAQSEDGCNSLESTPILDGLLAQRTSSSKPLAVGMAAVVACSVGGLVLLRWACRAFQTTDSLQSPGLF